MATFGLNHSQYNLIPILYSAFAIPASIAAGFLIDRVGPRICVSLFTTVSIIGLSVFAYAAGGEPDFTLFLVGRSIFGMGSESLMIWFATTTGVWFYYSEVAVSAAISLAFQKMGRLTADIFTPVVYRKTSSLSESLWISVYVFAMTFIIAIFINKLELYQENTRKQFKYIRVGTQRISGKVR